MPCHAGASSAPPTASKIPLRGTGIIITQEDVCSRVILHGKSERGTKQQLFQADSITISQVTN